MNQIRPPAPPASVPTRRARPFPKGRRVDPTALAQLRELLGQRPRRRDLLIEHLHLLQDHFGHLAARHLVALAEEMNLPVVEVYEVATFYAHFDIVDDGDTAPPAITVRVCEGIACSLAGAEGLIAGAAETGAGVRVVRAPCMGRCDQAPFAAVQHAGGAPVALAHASTESIRAAVKDGPRTAPAPEDQFDAYVAGGGYRMLADCLQGRRSPDEVIALVEAAGLRGLGGAGFPTGRKWRLVRAQPGPRFLVVNADEGEPGTFKDRYWLESSLHRFVEGALIAGFAIDAAEIYIYLRDEYHHLREALARAIRWVAETGLSGGRPLHLRRGAGAYVCGEESAMLESIEGKRGLPRHKPPFAAEQGLWGRPTLINNVETLAWIPDLLQRGPEWFGSHGRNGRQGLRSFSVSGRVQSPGVKIAPAGISVRALIEEYCGGMLAGHRFKAYLPGGASGGFLPAALGDVPLDFGTIEPHGGFIGSAAVVVLSDKDDLKAAALNLVRFFADESCGQCTPCRLGTAQAVRQMMRPEWDRPLLAELGAAMRDASICGLGQAAPNVFLSLLRHFPEEF